jgi:predicted metalloprotease with PDZ domain
MHSRQIQYVFMSALLLAATARADDPKPVPKVMCTAPAAECERAIRSMASGRRYLGALVEQLPNGGVRITSIATDSPAQRGGLGEGDRFMVANGHQLVHGDVKEFKRILSEAKDTGWVSFIVMRSGILKRVDVRLEPYTKAQIDKMVAQHMAEFHPQSATTTTQPQQ